MFRENTSDDHATSMSAKFHGCIIASPPCVEALERLMGSPGAKTQRNSPIGGTSCSCSVDQPNANEWPHGGERMGAAPR